MVPVITLAAWSLVVGAMLGLGLLIVVGRIPRLSRPRLTDRVAPYLTDVSDGAREYLRRPIVDPLPVLGSILVPVLGRLGRLKMSPLRSASSARLLRQAGSGATADQFRAEQLVWSAAGLAVGLVAVSVLAPAAAVPGLVAVATPAAAAVAGFLLRERVLRRAARRRLARMEAELPTVLEFLTLSLTAGEGLHEGLRRISSASSGELSREFASVNAEVSTGVPLAAALLDAARSLQLPPLTRCIDQMVGALERGSPLAEILRAQAQDARDDARRALLEVAGKKEVAMLVPLVFFILPLSILFAMFPGVLVLQTGF